MYRMTVSILLLAFLSAGSVSALAQSPSFDCSRASKADELAICSNGDLAILDRSVNAAYERAKSRVGLDAARTEGRRMLSSRAECGDDVDCLKRWHENAITTYDALGFQAPSEGIQIGVSIPLYNEEEEPPRPSNPVTLAQAGGDCLEKDNDWQYLDQSEVYNNGKLKFRIDEWSFVNGNGYVRIRSSAPQLNGRIDVMNGTARFTIVDYDICPGSEVSVRCEVRNSQWKCSFSEF